MLLAPHPAPAAALSFWGSHSQSSALLNPPDPPRQGNIRNFKLLLFLCCCCHGKITPRFTCHHSIFISGEQNQSVAKFHWVVLPPSANPCTYFICRPYGSGCGVFNFLKLSLYKSASTWLCFLITDTLPTDCNKNLQEKKF